MRPWFRIAAPMVVLVSTAVMVTLPTGPVATANGTGSEVYAVIQVETSPSYAGDPVNISSSQLQQACGGSITFETLQGGSTVAPRTSLDSITVVLDDDGNVTVVVQGGPCAPGSDLIESDLTVAPFLTATTVVDIEPPQVTPEGLTAAPANEVETGNSPASGESDVYTIFSVETSPVYAEQPVEISSPQLDDRCSGGWRWEPGSGTTINQTSGTTEASGFLDDDGNATFVFKGASCAAGPSAVIADVEAGTHPTYTTTYTVGAPAVTLASPMASPSTAVKVAAHRHHRHHHNPKADPVPVDPPAMTVDASPDPLVETGVPLAPSGLTIVKSDNFGGSSSPPTVGNASCSDDIIYYVTVTNTSSSTISGAVIQDTFTGNSDFESDTYTAGETGGASGFTAVAAAPGYNDIDDVVTLPPGSSVTYTIDAFINFDASGLTNTATVTPPSAGSLSAVDQDTLNDFSC